MDELKAVLDAVISTAVAIDQARADGKIDISDMQYATPLFFKLGPAVAGASKAYAEWKSASLEQRTALIASLHPNITIKSEVLHEKIEAGLAMLIHAGAFLN